MTKTLGSVLRTLLDDPRCHTRADWAAILNTTEEEIASWVSDEKLPPESTISRKIQGIVEAACFYAPDLRAEWESIVDLYSRDVTPLSDKMAPRHSMERLVAGTIGGYSLTYRYAGLLRVLGIIPYARQVAFLDEITNEVMPRYRLTEEDCI